MSSPPSRVSFDLADSSPSQQVQLENLREQLSVQEAIRDGAQNFLSVAMIQQHERDDDSESIEQQRELKAEIQQELDGAQELIERLEYEIELLETSIASNASLANGYDTSQHQDGVYTPSSSYSQEEERGEDTPQRFPALDKVQELLESLRTLEEEIGERIKVMDDIVDSLQEDPRIGSKVSLDEHEEMLMNGLSEQAGKDIRAATYRLLRHLLHDLNPHEIARFLLDRQLHFYLTRSLARDSKHDLEKEQALRLIRRILEVNTTLLSSQGSSSNDHERYHKVQTKLVAVLRGVVAIAEQPEEKLRLAALETLGELVIRDISLLVKCEGLRVVLQSMSEGTPTSTHSTTNGGGGGTSMMGYNEMSVILAMSFQGILDHPDLRKWLRPKIVYCHSS